MDSLHHSDSRPANGRPLALLVGSPRSGTTWVGKTFDSHPDTLYRHEPDSVRRASDMPLIVETGEYDRYAEAARVYLDATLRRRDPKTSGRLPVFPKRYYGPLRFGLRKYAVLGSKLGQRAGLSFDIPDLVPAGGDRVTTVWKSIESVGRAGLYAHVYPGMRVVHIVRHPCGHVASTLRGEKLGKFDASAPAAEDRRLFEFLLQTEVMRGRGLDWARLEKQTAAQRLTWRWLAFNEQLMLAGERNPGITSVAYEAICEEPEARFRELFGFCGLDWDEQTERFLQTSTGRDDGAYYSVTKDPLRAANRWRQELDTEVVEQILEIVKDSRVGRLFI